VSGVATSAMIGSRLPRGVVLEGTIRGQGDLRVGGEILGPIEIDGHLVIEEGGVVRGEIRARTITISGVLEGNATALELVRLEPGARMTGDARAERVSAAQGALLKGRVRTSQERAQLERMRRTTGGTLLAPYSSSGAILAPSSTGAISAPVLDRLTTEAVVARVTRDAVIDARDPATRDAHAAAIAEHAIVVRPTEPLPERPPSRLPAKAPDEPRASDRAERIQPERASEARAAPAVAERPSERARRAEMDRPPAPVMPAIGRRRAARRGAENAS
jgi:cytoskeletal protein CcmA (bactofilin family)